MSVLLPLGCCLVAVLTVPACTAQQGSDCSCSVTNSHCDELGVCRCDPGWDGELCDRCVPMPGCQRGSCLQPWQCSCEPGWGGRFCDKDLFVCSVQQPCQNGATCELEDSGEYTCLCPEGFHGRNCQLKMGPCVRSRSPCKNGGLCEDADGFAEELTCRCLAGFTGPRCETDIDDCLKKPCGNGATCLDSVNRFSCLCPAGFTGRFCTINLDDCASQPCSNAGRCLDRVAGFHCVCQPGYTGAKCETPLRSHDAGEHGWTPLRWHGGGGGGGGGTRHQLTTVVKNYRSSSNTTHHDNPLFRVTVSERSVAALSEVQLIILLVLAAVTMGLVVLTATLVLHSHYRFCGHAPCCTVTLSLSSDRKSRWRAQLDEQDNSNSSLKAAEPEKNLRTEVV